MRIMMFSYTSSDMKLVDALQKAGHQVDLTHFSLKVGNAATAKGYDAVCCFVNDDLSASVQRRLAWNGVHTVVLRCAGTDRVDWTTVRQYGMTVRSIPAYSPESVSEFALALMFACARNLKRTFANQEENNFSLWGLTGHTLRGKTIGLIGYGRIAQLMAPVCEGLGMTVRSYDIGRGDNRSDFEDLIRNSDVISIHCPLTEDSYHLIGDREIGMMKHGVILINTARGGVVDIGAVERDFHGGNHRHLGAVALDVFEGEETAVGRDNAALDFHLRLLRLNPEVIITGHQAWLTYEAQEEIAKSVVSILDEVSHA